MVRTLAFLFTATVCVAQPAAPVADRFTHIGVNDGLSQSSVTSIAQDRDGFMWFGTDDGLNRYDGVSFVVYRHIAGDSTSLLSSRIMDLHEDRHGTLWVGTQGGLQRLDRRSGLFHTVPGGPGTRDSPCGIIVRAVAETTDGTLWVGSLTGELCRRQPGQRAFEVIEQQQAFPEWTLNSLIAGTDGSLWVHGSTACVVRRGSDTCATLPRKTLPMYADGRSGLIGVLDDGGRLSSRLVRDRAGASVPLTTLEGVRVSVGPQTIDRVGDALWVGTEGEGVVVLDPVTGDVSWIMPRPTIGSGFRDGNVRSIYRDRSGAVWIGTTEGVSRWEGRGTRFDLYRAGPDGLSSSRVNGILATSPRTVWVATNDGLNRLDPTTGRVEVYRRPPSGVSVHPNAFWRILEDAQGRIVVTSRREGVFVADTTRGTFRRDPFYERLTSVLVEQPGAAAIRGITIDRQGRTWAGAVGGVAVHDPRTDDVTAYIGQTSRLPSHRINTIYEDRAGDIWLGTDAGLCRLDPTADVFNCLTQANGLSAEVIWTLAESDATPGVLWAGTIGGGLCAVDRDAESAECLALSDGLPSDVIYGVLSDDAGALWLTTTAGLVRLDPVTGDVRRYTEADGLQSNEFDLMAYERGPDGWMFVGGRRGLNRFHPARLSRRGQAPPVRFTGITVLGERRVGLPASGDTLRLDHDEAVFTIDFAALAYTAPLDNRYRFRLTGHDADWRETDGRRPTASYSRVPPGRYVLEVLGSNHDGVFTEEPERLVVEIRPAWWQRRDVQGLALVLLVGGLLGGGVAGIRQRDRRVEAERAEHVHLQRRLAESRERERYRIARDLHDGPVQGLYRLGHQLDRASLKGDTAGVAAAREQVNAVADELRTVLQALRPPIIEQLGVGPALSSLVRTYRRAHPETTIVDGIDVDGKGWPFEVQHALYRVAQEALTNAEKHASPSVVALRMVEDPAGVRLTVEDDGVGFRLPDSLIDLARDDHFGLVGLVERVEAHQGRIRVDSAPGEGTRISVVVPSEALKPASEPADTSSSGS
ncbi:MAG: two-component regulator propeller domain-containing protein [Bacteroidota bacterium]